MRVAFLYNRAADDPAQFAEDDDPSRSPVVAALRSLDHEVVPIACTLDLAQVRSELEQLQPQVAFNRVESLGGSDALAAAIPLLLDTIQIPYTGCPTEAIVATANKVLAKQRMLSAGLPTPEWIDDTTASRVALNSPWRGALAPELCAGSSTRIADPQFILKSIYEHASFEMNDDAVVALTTQDEIAEIIRQRSALTGKPFFAERYIEGREFNLSLIGADDSLEVLPPAEIDFSSFPAEKPRIVGFGAKWLDTSFEFQNTPRRFHFRPADATLLCWIKDLAVECWHLFSLRGYARVDFRVDDSGQPWILEINTNPCIAPTSGFAAALEQSGRSYAMGLQQIVEAAILPNAEDLPRRTQGPQSNAAV